MKKKERRNIKIEVWFDGACEPVNPGGHGTYGYVVKKNGKTIKEQSGYIGKGEGITNNVAEYTALIESLKFVKEHSPSSKVVVHGDSQLAIKQMNGEYAVRSPNIRPLWQRAKNLCTGVDAEFVWVPREQNEEADALSMKAYEEKVKL